MGIWSALNPLKAADARDRVQAQQARANSSQRAARTARRGGTSISAAKAPGKPKRI